MNLNNTPTPEEQTLMPFVSSLSEFMADTSAIEIRDKFACLLTSAMDSDFYRKCLNQRQRMDLLWFCLKVQEVLLRQHEQASH